MRRQEGEERLALGFGELLGIVQVAQPLIKRAVLSTLRKEDRRRHDRPGQRPAPGFIHAGDALEAA